MFARSMLCAMVYSAAAATAASVPTRVHIVAHTHDDPGWIKTADGYFDSEVHTLLSNTMNALLANRSRVFHYVEMIYFHTL